MPRVNPANRLAQFIPQNTMTNLKAISRTGALAIGGGLLALATRGTSVAQILANPQLVLGVSVAATAAGRIFARSIQKEEKSAQEELVDLATQLGTLVIVGAIAAHLATGASYQELVAQLETIMVLSMATGMISYAHTKVVAKREAAGNKADIDAEIGAIKDLAVDYLRKAATLLPKETQEYLEGVMRPLGITLNREEAPAQASDAPSLVDHESDTD